MTKAAQNRLARSSVVILGMSGFGCACASYLASAGVGRFTLVDSESVTEADLGDHVIFREDDLGRARVDVTKNRLLELNPQVVILAVKDIFDSQNAESLIDDGDIVVDALENWSGKFLASDVSLQSNKTLVHCGVQTFEFQIYTVIPGKSACLRCVFAEIGLEDMESQSPAKVSFGPVCGMAGSFQAIEVLKLLAGLGTTPGNHLIKFDALRRDFDDVMELNPRPDCPDCGRKFGTY